MQNIQHKFLVAVHEQMSPRYHRLALKAGLWAKKVKPGQFVHIRVHDGREPLFRRPFSVFKAEKYLEILFEPVGRGTELLALKRSGDVLDVLGPLGNHFRMPPVGITNVVMIAGGIGVAPFMILSDFLKKKKYNLTLLYGGRGQDHVFDFSLFKKNNCRVFVATDDGSVGVKGKVSQLFTNIPREPRTTFIYTCGPRPMMKAVQDFTRDTGLRGEASCEEVMACGLGACLGCAIQTTAGYKTVCYDGPVFDLAEIVF